MTEQDHYDLGIVETIESPFFDTDDIDETFTESARTEQTDAADSIATRRVLGMKRDFAISAKPLPGFAVVRPGDQESDEVILAAIDTVALASALRLSSKDKLNCSAAKDALLATARVIGAAPWRQTVPTLETLAADLSLQSSIAFDGLPPPSRGKTVDDCVKILDTLEQITRLPPTTRLSDVFCANSWAAFSSAIRKKLDRAQDTDIAIDIIASRAQALICASRLKPTFSSVLRDEMLKAGHSVDALAKLSDVPVNKLRKWLLGETPRKTAADQASALEKALGLPPTTLGSLVGGEPGRRDCDDVLTDERRRRLKAGGVSLAILPDDWSQLSRTERRKILAWIHTNILHGSPYRRYQRIIKQEMHEAGARGLHEPLPPRIAAELKEVLRFKVSRIALPGARRKATTQDGRRRQQHGGEWAERSTAQLVSTELRRLLTQLRALGIDTTEIGLGFLTSATVMRALTEAIARRRCDLVTKADAFKMLGSEPPPDGCFYVEGDANRLILLRGLLNSLTGYLFHNRPRLEILRTSDDDELIDQSFLDRAASDWPSLVAEQWEEIGVYADDVAQQAAALRDPSFGIQPILDLEAPYQALIDARNLMEDDRPDYIGSPTAAARHDRDHCLVSLTIAACPRRSNIGPLKYKQDHLGNDIGHLRRNSANQQFELHIPKSELKNGHSKALPPGNDLVIVLDPQDTRLYRSIERWLIGEGCSRDVLHGKTAGDHLFPGQKGGGICDPLVAQVIYRFSARYLVKTPWRRTGFVGVLPFGPHAIRDIVATHVLRATGSLEAAASAIFDTVETIEKRYAHINARDRGIRNIINIRLGLRASVDPFVDRLICTPQPLQLGSRT